MKNQKKRKLTPQEIKNQEFSKKLFGYDPDEVELFLSNVAAAYEELLKEVEKLKARTPEYRAEQVMERARKEIEKLVEAKKKELREIERKKEELEIEIEKLRFTQKKMTNRLKLALLEMTRILKELEEDVKSKEKRELSGDRGEGSAESLKEQDREGRGGETEDKSDSSS